MPSERVLVGGGTIYDPTAGYQSSNYYKFSCYDFYKYASTGTRLGNGYLLSPYSGDIDNGMYANYSYNIAINNLFTGILPYQNTYDNNYYCNSVYYWSGTNPLTYIYFDFNLPVVLTKYRMWNGFVNGIGNINPGAYIKYAQRKQSPLSSNIGSDYPRDWILYGTNDYINWTVVDSRSSQAFSYATSRLCSSSPYNEYSIGSPAGYKAYRLAVTKGSTNLGIGVNCNKGGCQYYNYPFFQLGEIQLLGYEDPSTSCSIHGFDKLFNGVSYSGNTNIKNVFGLGSPYSGHDFKKSDVFVNGTTKPTRTSWGPFNSGTSQSVVASSGIIDTKIGYTISGYRIKGSSSGSVARLVFYGSIDNSNWVQLNDTNKFTLSSSNYASFNFSNSYPFRYYKWNLYSAGYCDKGGCPQVTVNDIQIIGKPAQVGIPDMTSNTDPCGVASAADLISRFDIGGYVGGGRILFSPYNAFAPSSSVDGRGYGINNNTGYGMNSSNYRNWDYNNFLSDVDRKAVAVWNSSQINSVSYSNIDRYYLQYDFGKKTLIKGYSIQPASTIPWITSFSTNQPVQWSFYGSDDGTNWTKIETRTVATLTNGINNTANYWKGPIFTGYDKSGNKVFNSDYSAPKNFYLSSSVNYRMYRWRWEKFQPPIALNKSGYYDTSNSMSVVLSYIDVIPDNTTINTIPDAPNNLSYSFDDGNSTVNLTWSKPVLTGYSPVLSYNITYCATDGASKTINTSTSNTLYSFTSILLAGKTYKVSVSAVNKFGVGPETSVNISIPNFSSFAKIYVPVYGTPFDQNSTVTSRTIVVPNGATTLKAWACGDGRSTYFSNDGAGGLAWKTWNVSQNTSVNIQLGYNNCNQSGGESRVTYNGLTISGKPGSNGPDSLKYCSQSGGGTYSGGDGGANGAKGYGGAVGGNTAAYKNYNRYLMDPSKVSGLATALSVASNGTTDKLTDGTYVFNYNPSTTTSNWQPINGSTLGINRIYFDKVGSGGDNGGKSYYINPGLGGAGSGSGSTLGIGFIVLQWS